jgi:hypothetical protein
MGSLFGGFVKTEEPGKVYFPSFKKGQAFATQPGRMHRRLKM